MTPRELFEKLQSGEASAWELDHVQAVFFKEILRRQAGDLAKEKCVERIAFTPNNTNPWVVEIAFGDGELSEEAQSTLFKMKENAHRTEIVSSDKTTQVMFYVYMVEGNNE